MIKIDRVTAWSISNMGFTCRESLETKKLVLSDPDRKKRLEECACVFCYYENHMTTQAHTSRECSLCGELIQWGNGNTPNLCLPCAKKNKLCRWHVCDLDFKERRKEPVSSKPITPPEQKQFRPISDE